MNPSISSCFHKEEVTLKSEFTDTIQEFRVLLPNDYQGNGEFPVVYALDGNYTGSLLAGSMDFLNYMEKVPPSIVVSIPQRTGRMKDCKYNSKTGELEGSGKAFYKFMKRELIPYIDSNYATTSFKAILGHSFTANFINYFLFDDSPIFQGYIAISPYYAPGFQKRAAQFQRCYKGEPPVFYYLSQGERDYDGHIRSIEKNKPFLEKVPDTNFHFRFYEVPEARHSQQILRSLPIGLKHIFKDFSTFDLNDLERMKPSDTSALTQLQSYYKEIESTYGLGISYRLTDLRVAQRLLYQRENWKDLIKMGQTAIETYPEHPIGYYAVGTGKEQQGFLKEALSFYQKGYGQLGPETLNKEDFYEDIERVKEKIRNKKE